MAPQLTRDKVLDAAVELADREGIEAVTMRRLADQLGAGAMSLYHHLPNKDALLDGMVDRVFSEIELPTTVVDWKEAMRHRAGSTRAALRRHPWALGRMEATKSPGPADLRLHDAVLGVLRHAGFSVPMAVQAYSVQDAYIYGFALQEKTVPFGREELREVARERVQEIESRMADVARLYPNLAEVVGGYVAKEGFGESDAFEFGLDVILNGLEVLREGSR
jgi:AcrR family transcriptional regulator